MAATSKVSSSFITVLDENDGVPGSKFESKPENYTVEQLKRWLKCRGLKLSGKRSDLIARVKNCLSSGDHHVLDPSIDDGKWLEAKVLREKTGDAEQRSKIYERSTDLRSNPFCLNRPFLLTIWAVCLEYLESYQKPDPGANHSAVVITDPCPLGLNTI